MAKENALAVYGVESHIATTATHIENILEQSNAEQLTALRPMERMIVTAHTMSKLRDSVSDAFVKDVFGPLMGSKLGFRTDRDNEQSSYTIAEVKEVALEAMFRGFHPWGNEFNIIGGNFYATKEGLERKVKQWPGLTDLSVRPMNPEMENGVALVPCIASWKLGGKLDHIKCLKVKDKDGNDVDLRIPVRVNKGMIVDGLLGKAIRKMYAQIYERISGLRIDEGDTIETQGDEVPDSNRPENPTKAGTKAAAEDLVSKHSKSNNTKTEREPGEEG